MKKNEFDIHCLLALITFVLFLLLVAPVVHEAWHILFLIIYKCPYFLNWKFLIGITGEIEYFCELSLQQTRLLILSGVIGNLSLGLVIFSLCFYFLANQRFSLSLFSLFTAFSFIFSSLAYFFDERGDIVEFFETFGSTNLFLLRTIGILTLFSTFMIFKKSFQMIAENYFVSKLQISFDENRDSREIRSKR